MCQECDEQINIPSGQIGPTGPTGATGAIGPQGPAGENGVSSPSVLYNSLEPSSTNSLVYDLFTNNYNIPANKISTWGDIVEIVALFETSGTIHEKSIQLLIGGVPCHTSSTVSEFKFSKTEKYMSVTATISRLSSTVISTEFKVFISDYYYGGNRFYAFREEMAYPIANAKTIEIQAKTSDASEDVLNTQLSVKYYNIV